MIAFLKNRLLLMSLLLCPAISGLAQVNVDNYVRFFALTRYEGKDQLILRKFTRSGTLAYLTVNPQELTTAIVPAAGLPVKILTWDQATTHFENTAYMKTIATATQLSGSLQDAGIIHGFPKEKGITLTIDLCPSHKPLDRVIFTTLIAEFQKTEKPVPLAISVTGRWMLTHQGDLNWLKGLVRSGDIDITWVNHSYNHRVSSNAPLQTNFLLEPGTDLNFEILGTELAMIQQGLLPSIFFRFPGLVSDRQVVTKLLSYGIIPVGSDAWLAKGQSANSGSIVLIHGNGNEPVGVKDFIQLLKSKQADVKHKNWLLYDLNQSVEDEFSQ
ncbi:polysaccharide deacetylase [Pedobacter sp. MC2016-24]|uniref:polysaccharide deacetylase family protein n=1 Tax=Pedobacter sp. MC2016-24 TaxID=2780090 RepID=UPI0018816D82|nr:polysaccharide deacetylase [Pedobacter sp. MC2016-24]MBE9599803.1 polysaccharide deacetylase [Pedobacter sp. MC2016-24]